jgi:predicted PurR-regulated permease PerM
MILVLVLFLLAESEMLAPRVIRFFAPAPGDARSAERTFKAVIRKIRAYLIARTLLNLALGLAVAASLRILGVRFPLALGGFTALASFIPYIGQVLSGAVVILVALAHSGSLGDALIVAAVYVALVGLEGYVVMPIVMGRSLDLNGTAVLIACLFWGFLWGLVGLVLAIPITVSMKVVFQEVPRLHRWAELMSRDWQTPLSPREGGDGDEPDLARVATPVESART